MPLKIGQVSKLFNIKIETLRFYDKEKILQPSRIQNNGYRLYDMWDIFNLTELSRFRGLGFSLKEIKNIIENYNLETVDKLLLKRYDDLENNIQYQHFLSKYLFDLHDRITSVEYNINNFWIKRDYKTYAVICSTANNEKYTDFDEKNEKLREFLKTAQFYKATMITYLENVEANINKTIWTISLDEDFFKLFSIDIDDEVLILDSSLCVHTIIDMGEKGQLDMKDLKPALNYINERGFVVEGPIQGEILLRVHDNEEWHRYMELKIPVKK